MSDDAPQAATRAADRVAAAREALQDERAMPRSVPPLSIKELAQRMSAHFASDPTKALTAAEAALLLRVDRATAEACLDLCVKAELVDREFRGGLFRGDVREKVPLYRAGHSLRELAAKSRRT